MPGLIGRRRLSRLAGFATTQLAVQVIGFGAGLVMVRHMEQVQYGYFTLALSMVNIANILSDLGLSSAVLAIGGRVVEQRTALGQLVTDANLMHRRLALVAFGVLVPCFVILLLRQHAQAWQVAVLTLLIVASALLNVRNGVALSIARLLGNVALQQKLDLAVNLTKLAVLTLAIWLVLDATVACIVNLAAAAAYYVVLRRYLTASVGALPIASGEHTTSLRQHVWRQAPNSLYFVLSGQLAVWLIGIFGNAERVAEVGALGRLAALFTVTGAVSSALVFPYFARQHAAAALNAGFISVNGFFAAALVVLVALASFFPDPILWVLGGHYGALQSELLWMIVAATLSAWGGTLYGVGCARGWVMPVGLSISTGVLAIVLAASFVDVSTVRGSFIINAATGLAGTLTAFVYVAQQLRHHARSSAAQP